MLMRTKYHLTQVNNREIVIWELGAHEEHFLMSTYFESVGSAAMAATYVGRKRQVENINGGNSI